MKWNVGDFNAILIFLIHYFRENKFTCRVIQDGLDMEEENFDMFTSKKQGEKTKHSEH